MIQSNLPKIIAICGYKRCGKDTIAQYLCNNRGYTHIKIAAKLKEVVRTLFNFTEEQVEGDLKEIVDSTWGVTPRHVMQFMGTEMFQYKLQELLPNIERRFWILNLINENMDKIHAHQPFVISDLRFKHEYMELKKYGVYVIRVNKKNTILKDPHPSEIEFMDIPVDLEINNDGTIEDLYDNLKQKLETNQSN